MISLNLWLRGWIESYPTKLKILYVIIMAIILDLV